MSKLILSLDGSVIREIPVMKERLTIGRKPHNDIQIENLAVSGDHAAILTILNDSFLEDLGSTNGTLVNGNLVKKHMLQNNDVIEIGKYKLKYVAEKPIPGKAAEDFEKTMILRPAAATRPPAPPIAGVEEQKREADTVSSAAAMPDASLQPARAQPLAAIQILNGPSAGRELELTKNLTTLGKPGVQVAGIARRPQGYFITHLEGAAFPILNGQTLDAHAHPLADHDVVELAGVKIEFYIKSK